MRINLSKVGVCLSEEDIYNYNKNKLLNVPLFHNGKQDNELINDIKNSKIAIYTAFTGEYDSLKDPEFIDDNCNYICFTDNQSITSDIWKIIPMEESNLDNNRKAKKYKLFPHKYLADYEYSFWIDASFKIVGSIREYVYKYLKNQMLNVLHDERNCVYDEAIFSSDFDKYPTGTLEKQIKKYEIDGLPHNYGLVSGGFIFRAHHNPQIIKLMEDWWDEIVSYTNQDQVSFTYACWKNNFHPSVSDVYTWTNKYWTKEKGFRHKIIVNTPIASNNIIKNIESNKLCINDLTSTEMQLIYNDLTNIIYEEKYPMHFLRSRLIIHQKDKKYEIIKGYERKEENILEFDLNPFTVEKLIFVPSSKGWIKTRILSINTDAKYYKINNFNSINRHSDEEQLFSQGAIFPSYEIVGDFTNASYFKIRFSISPATKKDLEEKIVEIYNHDDKIINQLKNNNQQKEDEIKKLKNEIKKNKKEIIELENDINSRKKEIRDLKEFTNELLNSKSWKITKPLRKLRRILGGLFF